MRKGVGENVTLLSSQLAWWEMTRKERKLSLKWFELVINTNMKKLALEKENIIQMF